MKQLVINLLKSTQLFSFAKKLRQSVNYEFTMVINKRKFKGLKIYDARAESSEPWMGQLLSILLNIKKGKFIDVGVNIGQTLMHVKSIDSDREYVGFEPNPSCNMFAEELIRVNKLTNVNLVPVGLFTENSILKLDLYHDDITNSGGSLIENLASHKNIKPKRSILVPVMDFKTIDRSISIGAFEIVKIDVEGAEMEILESLFEQLKIYKPIIIVEIFSAYSYENHDRINRQKRILEIVNSLDYSILRIIEASNGELQEFQEIDFFDPFYNPNMCNYLFVQKNDKLRLSEFFEIIPLAK
jgi:FkbM family methyltransferase